MNLYLESQAHKIAANVALQNTLNQNNPQRTESVDFTDTTISVFNFNLRKEIQQKAQQCNDTSLEAGMQTKDDSTSIFKTCNSINSKIVDLQSTVNWASTATQEMANTEGLSESAREALNQSWGETSSLAASVVNNSISLAQEMLSKISLSQSANKKVASGQATTGSENPVKEAVEQTKNNLEIFATVATEVPGTTLPAEAKTQESVLTDNKVAQTKTETAKAVEVKNTQTNIEEPAVVKTEEKK